VAISNMRNEVEEIENEKEIRKKKSKRKKE
jgi:hypothetical protein